MCEVIPNAENNAPEECCAVRMFCISMEIIRNKVASSRLGSGRSVVFPIFLNRHPEVLLLI